MLENILIYLWLGLSAAAGAVLAGAIVLGKRDFVRSRRFSAFCAGIPALVYIVHFLSISLRMFVMYDPGKVFISLLLISPWVLGVSTLFSAVHLILIRQMDKKGWAVFAVFFNAGTLALVLWILLNLCHI